MPKTMAMLPVGAVWDKSFFPVPFGRTVTFSGGSVVATATRDVIMCDDF
jgi:lysophospholipid acyltransferase (LPLAT)-like uncharacterized protein